MRTLSSRPLEITLVGGTGFVGSALAARLAAEGHRLRLPTRDPRGARHLSVLPNADRLRIDVHDPVALRNVVTGSDVVVNLVGILNEKGSIGGWIRSRACRTDAESGCGLRRERRVSLPAHERSWGERDRTQSLPSLERGRRTACSLGTGLPRLDDFPSLGNLWPRRLTPQSFRRTLAPQWRDHAARSR